MNKYSLFIGRWQPWHPGHRWLIDQRLKEGKNVCVAIRDVEINKNQPWDAADIKINVETELQDLIEIIEHIPPSDIEKISATNLRAKMRDEGKL